MKEKIKELEQRLHHMEQAHIALRQRVTDLEQVAHIPAAHAPIVKLMIQALIAHHPHTEAVGRTFVELAQEIRQGLADQWARLPLSPQQQMTEQVSLEQEIAYWQQRLTVYKTPPHKPTE